MNKFHCIQRTVSILLGILLFTLGIFSFATFNYPRPIDVILPVYYVIFSGFILDTETNLNYLNKRFKLIQGLVGRGVFYFFIGTLCIRSSSLFQIIVAALFMAMGVYYFFTGCRGRSSREPVNGNPS